MRVPDYKTKRNYYKANKNSFVDMLSRCNIDFKVLALLPIYAPRHLNSSISMKTMSGNSTTFAMTKKKSTISSILILF